MILDSSFDTTAKRGKVLGVQDWICSSYKINHLHREKKSLETYL